jgi:hypothetical protein
MRWHCDRDKAKQTACQTKAMAAQIAVLARFFGAGFE